MTSKFREIIVMCRTENYGSAVKYKQAHTITIVTSDNTRKNCFLRLVGDGLVCFCYKGKFVDVYFYTQN